MSKPNPGSDAAIAMSCRCPVLDNHHGRGSGPWWISGDCPVHAPDICAQTAAEITALDKAEGMEVEE